MEQNTVRSVIEPMLLVIQTDLVERMIELDEDGFSDDDIINPGSSELAERYYFYQIHLDERGEFSAGVYSVKLDKHGQPEQDWDDPALVIEDADELQNLFDDWGFVKDDLNVAERALKDAGYIEANAVLIDNLNRARVDEIPPRDIFSWWVVSEWLFNRLRDHGEVTLSNQYGQWWGRSCTGQSAWQDDVMEKIAREYTRVRGG